MKRLAILSSAAAFAFLLAGPEAVKGQEITSTYTETEDAYIWEVTVTGIEAVAAIAEYYEGAFAEADALLSQVAIGNVVNETNVTHRTVFQNSGQDDAGIMGVNQASGSLNNQAIVRSIAIVDGGPTVQIISPYASQTLTNNTVASTGPRETLIDSSFGGTTGIVAINQAAGNLNQEAAVLALALGATSGDAALLLDDSALGYIGTYEDNSFVHDPDSPRSAVITNSFADFHGIAQVSQASGDLGRIANTMGVSVNLITVP